MGISLDFQAKKTKHISKEHDFYTEMKFLKNIHGLTLRNLTNNPISLIALPQIGAICSKTLEGSDRLRWC